MNQENSVTDSPRRFGLLRDRVQLVKKDGSNLYEILPIEEPLSFEKGFFIVIRASQLLAKKNEGVIFVGVAGPSGAGKTVFTEKVLNFMPSVALISMDNYNDSTRLVDGNFDDPRLMDYDTLLENIRHLKEGKPIEVPIYDFKTSSRIGYRTLGVPSSRIVIIEGIYALSEKLRPFMALCVSVTGGVHFDLVKRVLRDIHRVGQEPEEIIHQISETVYPMYKAFIEPDLQKAHIKIINKFNPFSGFQNPTYILKSSKALTVDQVKAIMPDKHTERLEDMYDIYLLPPGEDPETCQSYLRMRNRDGKYNLMFEEWVTDSPFIISPRISFGVSVRLFGGLMALGYTIATILKRSSHTFIGNNVVVKIDWLEQLNRRYVQVQGKNRSMVRQIGDRLGLEGSYIPHTYIEQFQLEKLVNDIMILPDDLKRKLSIDKDLLVRSKEALARAPDDRTDAGDKNLSSGSLNSRPVQEENKSYQHLARVAVTHAVPGSKMSEIPTVKQGVANHFSEQISAMNERMNELMSQIKELSSKLSTAGSPASLQNLILQGQGCDHCRAASLSGLPRGTGLQLEMLTLAPSTQSAKQCLTIDEATAIIQSQCQILHLLQSLSNLLHQQLAEIMHAKNRDRGKGNFRNPFIFAAAISGFSIFLLKNLSRS